MIECLAAVAYIAQYDVVFKECKNKKKLPKKWWH